MFENNFFVEKIIKYQTEEKVDNRSACSNLNT